MTPLVEDGYMYGVDAAGPPAVREDGDRRAAVGDGRPVRRSKAERRPATAFIVKNGDRFFLFTENGDLIIAKLSPEEVRGDRAGRSSWSRRPTAFGRDVVWSHPAFANKCVFARNDKEIVCVSLANE